MRRRLTIYGTLCSVVDLIEASTIYRDFSVVCLYCFKDQTIQLAVLFPSDRFLDTSVTCLVTQII